MQLKWIQLVNRVRKACLPVVKILFANKRAKYPRMGQFIPENCVNLRKHAGVDMGLLTGVGVARNFTMSTPSGSRFRYFMLFIGSSPFTLSYLKPDGFPN